MIATCSRKACNSISDNPSGWLVLRPMEWNAFAVELTYCSPQCLVMDTEARHRPPSGLLP